MSRPKLKKIEFRATLYRRRYLVPHAVTLGNMFCGFLAVIYATSLRFEKAALVIVLAILLDGLDGRVARRLNATSKFGVEFDSFSDLISFGLAPAILIYNWCFKVPADEFGVFICFVYALCAASRLARFNISDQSLKTFTGLPTPGAAAAVAALVYFEPFLVPSKIWVALGAAFMASLSYLMVSRIEYLSIKTLRIGNIRAFGRITLGAFIALIWYDSPVGLLFLGFGYAFSAPLYWAWRKYIKREEPKQKELLSA